jgi:myo-inositol 2-dehydrogenase/D-chiro-inositol 1-dehydrogenase
MSVGIGVIGAGIMGADHARLIAGQVQGAHLEAVADADQARAGEIARLRGTRTLPDGDALIADDKVAAVLIASPDSTHVGFVRACLAAGKPVLCEKPLAPTAAEALPLVEAEAQGGKSLVRVGFMRRFDPPYHAMRETLASGRLGRALMLHAAHRNVFAADWFTSVNSITNSAVHEFDILRWLFGEEIVAVTTLKPRGKAGVMDNDPLLLIVEMAGGVIADIEVFINAAYGYDVRSELVCENGTTELARLPAAGAVRLGGAGALPFPPDWRGRFEDAYRLELQAWVDSLGRHDAPGATAWDGYVASAVAEAGVASLRSGRRETVSLAERPAFYA